MQSVTSLDPSSMSYSFITISVTKIIIRLLTDVICMFAFKFLASVTFYTVTSHVTLSAPHSGDIHKVQTESIYDVHKGVDL